MTRKYVRIEKVHNGYVIKVGGPGTGADVRSWIAPTLEEVREILDKILNKEVTLS